MSDLSHYEVRTRILFGQGSSEKIGAVVGESGARQVLLVTGHSLKRLGIVDRLAELIKSSGVEVTVFAEVEPDPSVETIGKGARLLLEVGADIVVGIGGGSNLDAAKAIAVVAANGGTAADYGGVDAFKKDPLPIIALPTTAGTASEVTCYSVVTDTVNQRKFIITSARIAPRVAILDPELCASAPKQVITAAGMDALTHSIESYTSKWATQFTKANSIFAVKLISENLRRVVENPGDRQAMENMLTASCISGLAFNHSRLGIVHAIALPVGARFGVPHGIANAILLPYGMQYNMTVIPELYSDIAAAMGFETCGYSPIQAANVAIEMVQALSEDVGTPRSLREVGVREDTIPAMAKDAMLSGHVPVNPRPFSEEDVDALYRAAF